MVGENFEHGMIELSTAAIALDTNGLVLKSIEGNCTIVHKFQDDLQLFE